MAEKTVNRGSKASVRCYDSQTTASEVNTTLHALVRDHRMEINIWVISGTHGQKNGTVTADDRLKDFKEEDLNTANKTSKQIHIKDYHLLSPNTWKELDGKPSKTVLVLAWCYSHQWLGNGNHDGNNGKLSR